MPQSKLSLFCVGCITAPHGVRGQVTVKSFTEDPANCLSYGPLMREDGTHLPPLHLLHITQKGLLVVSLEGVTTREAADAYRGISLYGSKDLLLETTEDDEYYHDDLIGLAVHSTQGELLGIVKAIQDFGAGVLLEITPKAREETVLLPFRHDTVPSVDLDQGLVRVELEAWEIFQSPS